MEEIPQLLKKAKDLRKKEKVILHKIILLLLEPISYLSGAMLLGYAAFFLVQSAHPQEAASFKLATAIYVITTPIILLLIFILKKQVHLKIRESYRKRIALSKLWTKEQLREGIEKNTLPKNLFTKGRIFTSEIHKTKRIRNTYIAFPKNTVRKRTRLLSKEQYQALGPKKTWLFLLRKMIGETLILYITNILVFALLILVLNYTIKIPIENIPILWDVTVMYQMLLPFLTILHICTRKIS